MVKIKTIVQSILISITRKMTARVHLFVILFIPPVLIRVSLVVQVVALMRVPVLLVSLIYRVRVV
ncbi:hypothetical protein APM95_21640 [Salmonella enterica subsp. enterica serovar Muenchen]|nr:hypothetical protein [Salmonella enterica subsp. enterica serovar Muenchen]